MIEKITPRKLNTSKDARIQGAIEMYDAYNVSINEFTDTSGDSSMSSGTISGSQTGDEGVIKPAKGNQPVTQTALTADKKRRIIGSVSDEVNGIIYCFLSSEDAAEHGVYSLSGDSLIPVYTSKMFKFNSNSFIKADIVYAKNGPILYFTDGENEPRKLHVNRASEIASGGLNWDSNDTLRQHDFITACPKTPMHRPSFSFDSDPTVATNFAGSQGFQFAYQCIYDTGEETALSPYSNVAVPPSYLNQGSLSEPALNTDNVIVVAVPSSVNGVKSFTENIAKVRLLVRIGGRGSFFEVEEKAYDAQASDTFFGGEIRFRFSNDTVLSGVPQEDVDKLNDAVPKKAKTQAVVNDRLMYANYTEGFDELDEIDCSLSAYYNPRGEEFTNLEIGIKKLILPVGYTAGGGIQYNSNLKPSGTATDNTGRPLVYNRRTAYQFDLSELPSVIDAGTQLRLRLTIRPDKNFELYDSRNSFHAFKNVGYDAGQSDLDTLSINSTTRTIKKVNGGSSSDGETPATLQFNQGVVLDGVSWNVLGSDGVNGSISSGTIDSITTGHSPSCPFIIPSTSVTFSIALDFNESIEGESAIKTNISNCLINYFTYGNLIGDESYPVNANITLVNADSNKQSISTIDQGLSNQNGYGQLGTSNRDVAETIMKVYDRSDVDGISTGDNLLPRDEVPPLGFMAINRAELKCGLYYSAEANSALAGGANDIGPVFALQVEGLGSPTNPSEPPEYVTMIPRVYSDGLLNWWWASKDYLVNATDGNVFIGGEIEKQAFDNSSPPNFLQYVVNENLWFSAKHPLPNGVSGFQTVFSPIGQLITLNIQNNFFDDSASNLDIEEDFNNTSILNSINDPLGTLTKRRLCIGYPVISNAENRILKIVDLAENFSGNDGYNVYSIVDGEAHVRRSTVSNPENQNFWYGFIYGSEYLGKQNNMFPLSRGWKGGGGYPGFLHGLFSYGNKGAYADDSNEDGNIDSSLSATALDLILDESYPEAEVLNFASAVYSNSISLDAQSRSFKRYCSHDFGVVFFDERGRAGNVNPLGSVYVSGFAESPNTGSAFVVATFNQNQSNIPSWAHFYRMVYGGNSTMDDFVQYSAGGAFVAADSGGENGLIYVSLNHLQENSDVSYSKAFGAVKEDGDKDLYTFSAGDKLRIISYFEGDETSTRKFVNDEDHRFDVVGTVTLGKEDNPLVGENEDVHPAKMGQFVILKNNFKASGFSYDDVSQSRGIGAGTNTSDIYDQGTNFWNKRCVFEIYSPSKNQSAEDKIYYEIGKTYNIIKEGNVRKFQTRNVILTEGDVFFRKSAVNLQPFVDDKFVGLIGNGNGTFEERSEPNFESYYLETKAFTDNFPGADVKPFGKPRIVSREKEEVYSPSSIKFSDKTNPNSNLVRYTSFNNSKFPYKDLQNSDGPIYHLLNLNDSLFCIQQLKCSSIPVSRTVLSDALGNETVVTSTKVLGTERYYSGTHGTSHPESVVNVDNFIYFASSDQRKVYRFDSSQGIETISGKGMGSFFDRTLVLDPNKDNRVVGGYDPDTDEFILSVAKDVTTWSLLGFINPPVQPDGTVVVDDSVEGFVGVVDSFGGGLNNSDEFIEALLTSLNQINGLLEQEQSMFSNILQQASDIQTLLSGNFEPQFTGQTIDIQIGDSTYTIGPFSNLTSYNAELQELQASVFETLNTAVVALIGRYKELDDLYANILTVALSTTKRIQDQLQVLSNLISQVPQILGAGVLENLFTVSNLPFDAEVITNYLSQANIASDQASQLKNLYDAASPITVDANYVVNEIYDLGGVEIPPEFLTAQTESIKYLAVDAQSGVNFGEAIGYFFNNYTNLSEVVGDIEVSDLVADIFSQIAAGVADENEIINALQAQLYGPDLTPGGGDGGLEEDYDSLLQDWNTLLEIAYGPDRTPTEPVFFNGQVFLEGNNQVAEGYEGEIRNLESLIGGFVTYQYQLFQAAGQLHADIFGTRASGGRADYSAMIKDEDGNVNLVTETFTNSNPGGPYNFPGAGYEELVYLLFSGLGVDELQNTIDELNTEITNRTDVMNQVIDDYIGFALGSYDDVFRTDTDGSATATIIAGIVSVLNNRIPDGGLLASIYQRMFNFINPEGNFSTAPDPDNPNINNIVVTSDDGELNISNGFIASEVDGLEAVLLQGLDMAFEKILNEALADNDVSVPRSLYSLSQWYRAWNTIASNNTEEISPVIGFGSDYTTFSQQTIEPVVIIEGGGGGLETFAQLLAFFESGQLTEGQVRDIINGFRPGNDLLYVDFNEDGTIGSNDLLAFLGAFNQDTTLNWPGAEGAGWNGGGFGDFPNT